MSELEVLGHQPHDIIQQSIRMKCLIFVLMKWIRFPSSSRRFQFVFAINYGNFQSRNDLLQFHKRLWPYLNCNVSNSNSLNTPRRQLKMPKLVSFSIKLLDLKRS